MSTFLVVELLLKSPKKGFGQRDVLFEGRHVLKCAAKAGKRTKTEERKERRKEKHETKRCKKDRLDAWIRGIRPRHSRDKILGHAFASTKREF